MNRFERMVLVVLIVFAGAAAGDQQVEPPRTQKPLGESPASGAVQAQATPADAAVPGVAPSALDERPIPKRTDDVELINLDNTGIVSWRFLNPRRPVLVLRGTSVEFKNNTTDRTFSILVPIAVKTTDAFYRYPTLMRRPQVVFDREDTIRAFNLEVDKYNKAHPNDPALPPLDPALTRTHLDEIDRLLRIREVISATDVTTDLAKMNDNAVVEPKTLEARLRKPYADRRAELLDREKQLVEYRELFLGKPAGVNELETKIEKTRTAITDLETRLAKAKTEAERGAIATELGKLYGELGDHYAGQAKEHAVPEALATQVDARSVNFELRRIREELAMLELDRPRLDAAIAGVIRRMHSPDFKPETPPGTVTRVQSALIAVRDELDAQIKTAREARVAVIDKQVTDYREKWRSASRSWTARDRNALENHVGSANALLEMLDFHGKTDVNSTLASRFGGVSLRSCSEDASQYSCSAVRNVPPGQTTLFSDQFLAGIDTGTLIKFTVRFFDEAEEPANAVAYITRTPKPTAPKNDFTWGLTGSLGFKRDPFVTQREAVTDCALLVCSDGHKNHFTGTGRLDLKQRISNIIDGQGSLSFKEGDLGLGEDKLSFSKYQFNIYSEIGLAVQFGKMDFAAPSNGVALSESGEGFRVRGQLGPVGGGISYLLRRESLTGTADRTNLDSSAFLIELNNVLLSKAGPFRSMSVYYVDGSDETPIVTTPSATPDVPATVTRAPYDYSTWGTEVRYALPIGKVNGNISYYSSRRDAEDDSIKCAIQNPSAKQNAPCNGRGSVWLLTGTRSFAIDPSGKALRSVGAVVGWGSGDDASTDTMDESYVGETGGYKPDLIFLSSLANVFSNFKRFGDEPPPGTFSPYGLGAGLANKGYWSLRYTDNSFSPLLWLVRAFEVSDNDIAGYSTIVTYHNYRLRRPFSGERNLGDELDVEFQLESPKGVKGSVKGGYFRPQGAAERFVEKDIWSISLNLSLSI